MAITGRRFVRVNQIIGQFGELSELAFVDGRFGEVGAFGIPVKAHLAHYASSIFEGLRFFARAGIFLLEPHQQRFRRSIDTYRFVVPEGYASMDEFLEIFWDAVKLVVAINSAKQQRDPDLYIRPWMGRGVRSSGSGLHVRAWHSDPAQRVRTTYAALTESWPSYIDPSGQTPVAVVFRRYERPTRKTAPVWAKGSMNYPVGTEASGFALQHGGQEALMIRTCEDGTVMVLDGPGQAIAIVESGMVISPDPETSDILASTQMHWFKDEVAPRLGIPFEFGDLSLDRIYGADELLFMGSATGIVPFGSVVDPDVAPGQTMMIGSGQPGQVYLAFQQEYERARSGQDYGDSFAAVPSTLTAMREVAGRIDANGGSLLLLER